VFKRAVNAIELLAVIAAVVFVVLLGYRPKTPQAVPGVGSTNADVGAAVYGSSCSSCHGAKGEGAIGPKLAGGAVVARFPNAQDETAVVTNGRGSMPAWRNRLTPDQIEAVVEYTRTHL
jgi:mono/diheme cytochrome c family protein